MTRTSGARSRLAAMTVRPERVGRWLRQPGGYEAFLPARLPPDPPVDESAVQGTIERCVDSLSGLERSLRRFESERFAAAMVIVEATASCAIEGVTPSSSEVVAAAEGRSLPSAAARVVLDYVDAFEEGRQALREGHITLELIQTLHSRVLGDSGRFRKQQNFIAAEGVTDIEDAVFVPPPPEHLLAAMENWIEWHRASNVHPLTTVAVAHAHFLTIHPFRDGNGRVARIVTGLALLEGGVLHEPVLAFSAILAARRSAYYGALTRLREDGSWELWLDFFLNCLTEAAEVATAVALRLPETGESEVLLAFLKEYFTPALDVRPQVTGLHDDMGVRQ